MGYCWRLGLLSQEDAVVESRQAQRVADPAVPGEYQVMVKAAAVTSRVATPRKMSILLIPVDIVIPSPEIPALC